MSYEERIQALENTPVAGNFHQDSTLWFTVDTLVADDEAPMPIRVRALAIVDRITGEPGELTPDAVREYTKVVRDGRAWLAAKA